MIDLFALGVAIPCGIAAGMVKNAWDNRDISSLKRIWKDTLLKCNVPGIRLKVKDGQDKTFVLTNVTRYENGFKARSLVPRGLDYGALINAKNVLESNLNAKLEIDKDIYCKWININITTNRPEIKYKKINCSSDYLFGGYYLDGKPNLVNLNVDAHVLWTGTTGTGKTVGLFMALTNLIANRKKYNHFQLYFEKIVNRETSLFADCPGVKGFANNLIDAEKMLKKIMKIKESRAELLEKTGCKDINQYNKYNPTDIQDRIIFVTEEFSFFKVGPAEDPSTEKLKLSCERMLLEIVKAGRSNNINLLTVLQRPTVTNLDTTIRSQLSVITFKLKSENDSKIAIQDKGAEKLRTREAIFDSRGGLQNLLYPVIDEDMEDLRKLVPQIRKPNIKTIQNKVIGNDSNLSYEETQDLKRRAKIEHLEITNQEYLKKVSKEDFEDSNNKYNGKYSNEIMEFLDRFGVITVSHVKALYSKSNADRILSDYAKYNNIPLNQGEIIKNNAKVYYKPGTEPTLHKVIIADYFVKLATTTGVEIIKYNTCPILKHEQFKTTSKSRKPDLEIIFTYKNKTHKVYLEVDDTHKTDSDKIDDYYTYYSNDKFELVILDNEIKKERIYYKNDMMYKIMNYKKYSVLP